MQGKTTAEKLELLVLQYGCHELLPEIKNLQRREQWIEEAENWLEGKSEREAIKAEARAAAVGQRHYGRIP